MMRIDGKKCDESRMDLIAIASSRCMLLLLPPCSLLKTGPGRPSMPPCRVAFWRVRRKIEKRSLAGGFTVLLT